MFRTNKKYGYLKNITEKSDVKKAVKIVRDMRRSQTDVSVQGAALVALFNLGKKLENRFILFNYGVVEQILIAMRSHPEEETLLEAACAAVVNTSGNPYGSIKIGVGDEILRCMESFPKNSGLQENACLALSALSFSPFAACYLVNAKAGEIIKCTMDEFKSNQPVLSAACSALWAMCSHASKLTNQNRSALNAAETSTVIEMREELWNLGLAQNVSAALKQKGTRNNVDLTENVLGAIWSLDHPFVMMKLGCGSLVLKCLKFFPDVERLVEICCSIMARYGEVPTNAKVLVKKGAATSILTVLKNELFIANLRIREAAFFALCHFAFWEENKTTVYKEKVHDAAITALEEHAEVPEILEAAIGVLGNLATSKEHASHFLSLRVHKTVVALAKQHSSKERVQVNTVNLLRNLSFYDELRVLPLVGTVPLIKGALEKFPDNAVLEETGTEALARIKENRV